MTKSGSINLDEIRVQMRTSRDVVTPKAIQDLLDEFEAECKSDYPHALQALWNELERQDALHYYLA